MSRRKYEVQPVYERIAGVDEVIAWQVVADVEQRGNGHTVYDLIDLFEDESDAIDLAGELNAREARDV